MLAVSNTSPLSNLAFLGRLDLLKSQVAELCIPTAVAQELKDHPDAESRSALEAALRDGWIRIAAAEDTRLKALLMQQLHTGEAEAISLAVDLKADLLVIDEQEGRGMAEQAGLVVTGTLGVLLRAKRNGHISAVRPELEALRAKTRFFLSSKLEAAFLAAADEG